MSVLAQALKGEQVNQGLQAPALPEGTPTEALLYSMPEMKETGRQPTIGTGLLANILGDPRFSPATKIMGMKIAESIQPQKREFLTLGPDQEAIDLTTGQRIKGPQKRPHWQAVQGEDNFWLLNPETGEFKETNTPVKSKGQFSDPYKDENGNLAQKNLKTDEIKILSKAGEEAPKTRELKHGTEIITQEYDAKTKTWKTIARGPRKIKEESDELKAAKAKQIVDLVGQNFGLGKDQTYEDLGLSAKFRYDAVLEAAQKNAHTMDPAGAVNKAMKDFKPSREKVYEKEPILNPKTQKWEYPENKGHTGRWKYLGETEWRPGEKTLDEATAKAILDEAGGDKKKAREIAKGRGYKF